MRKNVLLVLLGLGICGSALASSHERSAAVVLKFGDIGNLQQDMDQYAQKAQSLYTRLGFKNVSLLTPESSPAMQPVSENFFRILNSFRDIEDLRVDFLGHGSIVKIPEEFKQRYPKIVLSETQKLNGQQDYALEHWSLPNLGFVAVNTTDGSLILEDPDLDWGSVDAAERRKKILASSMGVGDLRVALKAFLKNNPKAHVTLQSMNCFSGVIGEQLRDIPQIQVFANSSTVETGTVRSALVSSYAKKEIENFKKSRPDSAFVNEIDFSQSYTGTVGYYRVLEQELDKGTNSNLTYGEAFRKVLGEALKEMRFSNGFHLPRSALSLAVSGACTELGKNPNTLPLDPHKEKILVRLRSEAQMSLDVFETDEKISSLVKYCASEMEDQNFKAYTDQVAVYANQAAVKLIDAFKAELSQASQDQMESLQKLLIQRYDYQLQQAERSKVDASRVAGIRARLALLETGFNWIQYRDRAITELERAKTRCRVSEVFSRDCNDAVSGLLFEVAFLLRPSSTESVAADECMKIKMPEGSHTLASMRERTLKIMACRVQLPADMTMFTDLLSDLYKKPPSNCSDGVYRNKKLLERDLSCVDAFARSATEKDWEMVERLFELEALPVF